MSTKVYGWRWHVAYAPTHGQVRAFCAAPSKAALARLAGVTSPARLLCLTETHSAEELALAARYPGQILIAPLHGRGDVRFYQAGQSWDALRPVPREDKE